MGFPSITSSQTFRTSNDEQTEAAGRCGLGRRAPWSRPVGCEMSAPKQQGPKS